MATPGPTISASTQSRILVWRSEVASAMDDSASTAASSTGVTSSFSDSQSSGEQSLSQPASGGAMARGRRFWRRITRRLSGGRFGGFINDEYEHEQISRTAMYRVTPLPAPPVDALGAATPAQEFAGLGDDSSSDDKGEIDRRLRETLQRLDRAARLRDQQPATAT
ncbi:hypothetical protein AAL_04859 [Moelleriella libera RCEF 2490]|uniref:Uncharacterized protein n=1 Tax=Moelleriella libera RCEF 2490 TaxID=1081109 RepID=A0A168B3R1_9HYPO|nr:hypothetical protein AAL_04859 [Moelleriella libera RCEF 2490]